MFHGSDVPKFLTTCKTSLYLGPEALAGLGKADEKRELNLRDFTQDCGSLRASVARLRASLGNRERYGRTSGEEAWPDDGAPGRKKIGRRTPGKIRADFLVFRCQNRDFFPALSVLFPLRIGHRPISEKTGWGYIGVVKRE
jgi:hypothetical protein